MHLSSFFLLIHQAFDFYNGLSLNQFELGGKDPKFSLTKIRTFVICWTKGIKKSFLISASHLGFCKHHSSASSSSVTNLAVSGRGEEQIRLRLERAQVRASLGAAGREVLSRVGLERAAAKGWWVTAVGGEAELLRAVLRWVHCWKCLRQGWAQDSHGKCVLALKCRQENKWRGQDIWMGFGRGSRLKFLLCYSDTYRCFNKLNFSTPYIKIR